MKITDKERKKYLKETKALLVCSAKERRRFIREFESNIDDFVIDNPDSSIDDLRNGMGSPQEIAEGFIADISPKRYKKQTSIIRIIIVFLSIATFLFGLTLFFLWFDAHKSHESYTEIDLIEYSEEAGTTEIVNHQSHVYYNNSK